MSDNVYMYHQLAISGGESMNNANTKIPNPTTVDALNAALLLLKMEGNWFEEQHQEAWADKNGDLTPIGQKLFNEINQLPVCG